MTTNANPPGPNDLNYSQTDNLVAALVNSTTAINWADASVALWVTACVAAGKSVGVPGCPSLEVAEAVKAILGA